MEKRMETIYEAIKFVLKSEKLNDLLRNAGVELGEYGECNIEQFLTRYSIYKKADNGNYGDTTADILANLYDMIPDLLIAIYNDPKDNVTRERFLKIVGILDRFGVRTNLELNAIMRKQLKRGSKHLPSEEQLEEFVKTIIPERKAQ